MSNEKRKKELRSRIKEIHKRIDELKPLKDEYYALSHTSEDLYKELRQMEAWEKRDLITSETKYVEPTYPDMGVEERNGSAVFKSKKQAELLLEVLKGSYYYAYVLEWSGKGEYIAKPSYNYDHDGEVVYTCTFRKEK